MDCVIDTAVIRAKTAEHFRVRGIYDAVALQCGDVAFPQVYVPL